MRAESVDILIVMNMVRFEENILVIVAVELLSGIGLINLGDQTFETLFSTLIPDASRPYKSRTSCAAILSSTLGFVTFCPGSSRLLPFVTLLLIVQENDQFALRRFSLEMYDTCKSDTDLAL